jgi:hypothetical protein
VHDKIEKFRAVGDDGENYLIVRMRPYRRSDTLEGVGGYLDFAPPRLSSGEVLEPARSPGTYRVPQTGVVLTVEPAQSWLSGGALAIPMGDPCNNTKEERSAPSQRSGVFIGWPSKNWTYKDA